jgi:hypothetical protein
MGGPLARLSGRRLPIGSIALDVAVRSWDDPTEKAGQGVPAEFSRMTLGYRVEDRGLEPLTFWLPARRSPN